MNGKRCEFICELTKFNRKQGKIGHTVADDFKIIRTFD